MGKLKIEPAEKVIRACEKINAANVKSKTKGSQGKHSKNGMTRKARRAKIELESKYLAGVICY